MLDIDRLKLVSVREFVKLNFPPLEYEVEEFYSDDRSVYIFRLRKAGAPKHTFGVSREFFNDHSAPEIERLLDDVLVDEIKRVGPERMTILTRDGLQEKP